MDGYSGGTKVSTRWTGARPRASTPQQLRRSKDRRVYIDKTLVTTPNSDIICVMSYVDLGKGDPIVFNKGARSAKLGPPFRLILQQRKAGSRKALNIACLMSRFLTAEIRKMEH